MHWDLLLSYLAFLVFSFVLVVGGNSCVVVVCVFLCLYLHPEEIKPKSTRSSVRRPGGIRTSFASFLCYHRIFINSVCTYSFVYTYIYIYSFVLMLGLRQPRLRLATGNPGSQGLSIWTSVRWLKLARGNPASQGLGAWA